MDTLRARHPDHQAAPGVAAVLTQLHDSKPRPFVLASWRSNMAKNTGDKQAKDEETISDQEIWWIIRYLDPDAKDEASDRGVIITSLALFAIVCVVVAVLYSRGL
jgi:hypothetical protein